MDPTGETFQELMHVAAEAGQPAAAEQWMNQAWQEPLKASKEVVGDYVDYVVLAKSSSTSVFQREMT